MVDVVLTVAIALLLVGVVASVLPVVPGAVFTLSGLVFYRWMTGEPGLIALAVLVLLALTAVVLDYLATAVSARAGGASWRTSTAAVLVGIVLAFVSGPVGFLGGTGAFVFVVEAVKNRNVRDAWDAAVYTTTGVVVSAYLRVLLNLLVLVIFVALAV